MAPPPKLAEKLKHMGNWPLPDTPRCAEMHLAEIQLQEDIERRSGTRLDADCELKYAHYPCGGRYQRHVDGMNAGSVAREYSFLLYLNAGWAPRDGGHLRVFDLDEAGHDLLGSCEVPLHKITAAEHAKMDDEVGADGRIHKGRVLNLPSQPLLLPPRETSGPGRPAGCTPLHAAPRAASSSCRAPGAP